MLSEPDTESNAHVELETIKGVKTIQEIAKGNTTSTRSAASVEFRYSAPKRWGLIQMHQAKHEAPATILRNE